MHIFPEPGFDQSVTTPVLLGVWVSWLFTETFGWVFAGLVVPGYLAALFLVHPRSALIDVVEAVITYGVARLIGEGLPRTGLTSRVFGRERFLLILVVSVLVRLTLECVVFAQLAGGARWAFSTGLVVVPLAANACWKTGLRRGIVQHGVPTLIVYGVLRYGLLAHTNLSLSGFHLATENVAASFLASPKAYILLLTGAVLAAAANVRYGWDYNGILIPALLGLVVTNPVKLAATFAEVLLLLAAFALLQRATPLGRWNIEGPRRPALFFTIDYALRFGFASFVSGTLPGTDVIDLMGFGYLLPTLLAVKVTQRGIAALVLLPALSICTAAFALSNVLGFSALLFDDATSVGREPVTRARTTLPREPVAAALWLSALARPSTPRSLRDAVARDVRVPRLIDSLLAEPQTRMPAHLQAEQLDSGIVLLRERFQSLEHRAGDPAVLAAPASSTAPHAVLLVPSPLVAPESAALAARLLQARAAQAVVVESAERAASRFGLETAAESVAAELALRLAKPAGEPSLLIALRRTEAAAEVKVAARAQHDPRVMTFLRELRALVGELPVQVGEPNRNEDVAVSLPFERGAAWLLADAGSDEDTNSLDAKVIFAVKEAQAPHASLEESLALRRLLLEPLLSGDSPRAPGSLALLHASAHALGYHLMGGRVSDGSDALLLFADSAAKSLALLIRDGAGRGLVLAIPNAHRAATREFGTQLGAALGADAVLFGFEPGGALGGDALRGALEVAQRGRRAMSPRVVVVRDAGDGGAAELSTWGGTRAGALAAQVDAALDSLHVRTSRAELDPRARDEAGASIQANTALVMLSLGSQALRPFAIDARLTRSFPTLRAIDDDADAVALQLVSALPARATPASPELLRVAERAILEESVTARRELEVALANTACAAALARSARGAYLVVVGKTSTGLVFGALASTQTRAPDLVVQNSAAACAAELRSGGTCRVVGASP